ncbi:MAG: MFS transporter [Clostridia bacterium]|nr:MFS transporter [Clostridia bacterium]
MENMKREVSIKEKLIFASADFFGGGGQTIVAIIYLIFLTNVIGINPAWAGTVVMISKLWDAISDPLMGVISDNTRSKFGRRKPYIFAGGIILIISMGLLWYPVAFGTQVGLVIYVTVTYLLYSTVSTMISVPYSSLSTELSTRYEETNRVNLLRLVFSLISTAICTIVPVEIFGMLSRGQISLTTFYILIVVGFGLFFSIPLLLTGIFTKERVSYGDEKSHFSFAQFVKPLKVKSFRRLLGLYLCQSTNLDILSAIALYYALYVIKGMDETIFMASFLVVQLLMLPILNLMVNKVSKTKLYRFGLPISIVCAVYIGLFPSDGNVDLIYMATALMAMGFAGAQTMSWIIFPDVVDIAQLGLGERISGSLSGVMTFVRKAASAIAIFIIGQVLSITGFIKPTDEVPIPVQSESTVLGLRLILIFAWLLIMGVAFLLARQFKITPEVSKKVKYLLAKETLTEEDEKEKQEIIDEFV